MNRPARPLHPGRFIEYALMLLLFGGAVTFAVLGILRSIGPSDEEMIETIATRLGSDIRPATFRTLWPDSSADEANPFADDQDYPTTLLAEIRIGIDNNNDYTEERRKRLHELFASHAKFIALADAVSDSPDSRLSPSLLLAIQDCLVARGRLALDEGDNDTAMDSLRRAKNIAGCFPPIPVLIIELTRFAMGMQESVLFARGIALWPDAMLDDAIAQTRAQADDAGNCGRDLLMGEFCFGLKTAATINAEREPRLGETQVSPSPRVAARQRRDWLRLWCNLANVFRHLVDVSCGEAGPQTPETLRREREEFEKHMTDLAKTKRFSAYVMPALQPSIASVVAKRILLAGIIEAGVAVERFRRETGRLPESLADLVPERLAAVPVDPRTGVEVTYEAGWIGPPKDRQYPPPPVFGYRLSFFDPYKPANRPPDLRQDVQILFRVPPLAQSAPAMYDAAVPGADRTQD